MKLHYIILFLFFTLSTMAQEGKSIAIPSKAIPRVNPPKSEKSDPTETPQYSINKPFEPSIFKVPPKVYDEPKIENKNKFNPIVSDLNPSLEYEKRLNKNNAPAQSENMGVYRRNQFLGELKIKSKKVRIVYRDFGEVDGDMIRILVNDQIATYEIVLESNFKGIELELVQGFNKVEFEALNQGRLGPNTAELQIYDDKETLISSNQWNLGTGFKASVVIVKE